MSLWLAACSSTPPPKPPPQAADDSPTPDDTLVKPRVMDDGVIAGIFAKDKKFYEKFLADEEKLRLEVLYTQIDGDKVTRHGYRADLEYFYPASAVKPALAIAALESLREKNIETKAPFRVFTLGLTGMEERDGSGNRLNVQREIEKLLVFSDNDSYNRLYSIVGQREANTRMWRMGLDSVRIRTRLMASQSDDGSRTPRVDWVNDQGQAVVTLDERTSTLNLPPPGVVETDIGVQHIGPSGEVVAKPMAFAERNRISLVDLQDMLALIVRPDLATVLGHKDVPQIRDADREMLLTALAAWPSHVAGGNSPDMQPLDELHKPALAGALKSGRPLKVYSKAGRAYGFLVENACIVDREAHKGIFLTMNIFVGEGNVVGDDKYPYEDGMPFLIRTAELVTKHAFGEKKKK